MKDYKDMAENVLKRRDKYIAERRKQMKRVASVLSCFCLVALLGAGVWRSNWLLGNGPTQEQGALQTGTVLPGGAPVGNDTNKWDPADEVKRPAPTQEGSPAESDDHLANNEDIDNTSESSIPSATFDAPVVANAGDTGALIAYDEVWGGSYMDQDGRWVILLTEDTAENRQKVFDLNPTLSEDNATFKPATYTRAYLANLMEELSRAELPACVSSIGLQEDLNRIVVYMTSEDADSIEKVLAFDSIGGAIEFQLLSGENIIPDTIKMPMS